MASVFGDTVDISSIHPYLKRQETPTSSGSTVVSYNHDLGSGPVLWLVHGYPQSAYMYGLPLPVMYLVPRRKLTSAAFDTYAVRYMARLSRYVSSQCIACTYVEGYGLTVHSGGS